MSSKMGMKRPSNAGGSTQTTAKTKTWIHGKLLLNRIGVAG
jgi:hypothetical protein